MMERKGGREGWEIGREGSKRAEGENEKDRPCARDADKETNEVVMLMVALVSPGLSCLSLH